MKWKAPAYSVLLDPSDTITSRETIPQLTAHQHNSIPGIVTEDKYLQPTVAGPLGFSEIFKVNRSILLSQSYMLQMGWLGRFQRNIKGKHIWQHQPVIHSCWAHAIIPTVSCAEQEANIQT